MSAPAKRRCASESLRRRAGPCARDDAVFRGCGDLRLCRRGADEEVTIIRPATQSADDFYPRAQGAPLWFTPKAGDAADQVVALLSSSSLDGLSPERARSRPSAGDRDSASGEAQGRGAGRPNAFERVRFLSAGPEARPGPRHPVRRPFAQAGGAVSARGADQASNAPSLSSICPDMGWMSPIYAELRKALADHRYIRSRTAAADAEPPSARGLGGGPAATSSSTPRSSGSTPTRTASRSIQWSWSWVAQIPDADDDRLCAVREPQPVLVRPARFGRGAHCAKGAEAGPQISRRPRLSDHVQLEARRRSSNRIRSTGRPSRRARPRSSCDSFRGLIIRWVA